MSAEPLSQRIPVLLLEHLLGTVVDVQHHAAVGVQRAERDDERVESDEPVDESVDEAAAPFGLYDRQVVADLRKAGFTALYTSDRGVARSADFIRPRNCLEGTMGNAALEAALRGRVRSFRAARRAFGVARKRLLPLRLRV